MTTAEFHPIYEKLQEMCEGISFSKLQQFSGHENLNLNPLPKDFDLSFDHWISLIIVMSSYTKITLKCHFSSLAAKDLVLSKAKIKKELVTPQICHSFIGEYCNLVGGEIKNKLLAIVRDKYKRPLESTLTIPEKRPSYYEGIGQNLENSEQNIDGLTQKVWKLSWGQFFIIMHSEIMVEEKEITSLYGKDITSLIDHISCYKISDEGTGQWL